jgi:hypothetical protein
MSATALPASPREVMAVSSTPECPASRRKQFHSRVARAADDTCLDHAKLLAAKN